MITTRTDGNIIIANVRGQEIHMSKGEAKELVYFLTMAIENSEPISLIDVLYPSMRGWGKVNQPVDCYA